MPSLEIILSAFLAISLTASIISSKARAPYTIILVLFGVAIAGSSLSSILGVSLLYDSLVGGGLFVGLVLPPLLFETTMNISCRDCRALLWKFNGKDVGSSSDYSNRQKLLENHIFHRQLPSLPLHWTQHRPSQNSG